MIEVQYEQIRSNVIAPLLSEVTAMKNLIEHVDQNIVEFNSVCEGEVVDALNALYEGRCMLQLETVKKAIESIAHQLEEVCKEFDTTDVNISDAIRDIINGFINGVGALFNGDGN